MNANAIQEKILSDARTSASDIMRDANEKAARLRDAAEKRMAAAHSRLMMQASEDAEAARLRMERMEELEERKRLLSDKRALIDEAFAQALCAEIRQRFPAADVRCDPLRGLCSYYAERGGIMLGFET